jgi:MFS family permease
MAERNILAANVTAFLLGVSLFSVPVLVSRAAVAPEASGYGAGLRLGVVGFILASVALGNVVGGMLADLIARRFGPRFSLACGGLVAAVGSLLMLSDHLEVWRLLAAMSLSACGAGAAFATMSQLIVISVAAEETGSATSLNMLLRAVGGAVGSAATAALLGARPGPLPDFPGRAGFWSAFVLCGAACVLSVIASLAMPMRLTHPWAGHSAADPTTRSSWKQPAAE